MSINRHNREFDSEKDSLIVELRKQIFDLEQNEKSYSILNSKYKNLQNDYNIVSESKLKQEYEYKQRLESANKEIFDLKGEVESVQQTLEDRISLNKKLFQDNSALHKLAEDRALEIVELKENLFEAKGNFDALQNIRQNLDKQNYQLQSEVSNQKDCNGKLAEDNEKLSKIVDDQESIIRALETEKRKLLNKQDELNFEAKSLAGKLAVREENLNQTNKKLDELNRNYSQLENRYSDLDTAYERSKAELANTKKELIKEKGQRADGERAIEKLEASIREKEKELRNALEDIDTLKSQIDGANEEKARQVAEIEKLKYHIITLTEQNQVYADEIENYLSQDEKIKQQLYARKDKSEFLLRSSKGNIEKSLKNLDEFFNKTARVSSPSRYTNTNGRQTKP